LEGILISNKSLLLFFILFANLASYSWASQKQRIYKAIASPDTTEEIFFVETAENSAPRYELDKRYPLRDRLQQIFIHLTWALEPPSPEKRIPNSYDIPATTMISEERLSKLVVAICKHRYRQCRRERDKYKPCFLTLFGEDPTKTLNDRLNKLLKEKIRPGSEFVPFREKSYRSVSFRQGIGSHTSINSIQLTDQKALARVKYYRHGVHAITYDVYLKMKRNRWVAFKTTIISRS